jgi:hypothetical protein
LTGWENKRLQSFAFPTTKGDKDASAICRMFLKKYLKREKRFLSSLHPEGCHTHTVSYPQSVLKVM